jgi:hypothetical protein
MPTRLLPFHERKRALTASVADRLTIQPRQAAPGIRRLVRRNGLAIDQPQLRFATQISGTVLH